MIPTTVIREKIQSAVDGLNSAHIAGDTEYIPIGEGRVSLLLELQRVAEQHDDEHGKWLDDQAQAERELASPDHYPPGDKRPEVHRGRAEAYEQAATKWNEGHGD